MKSRKEIIILISAVVVIFVIVIAAVLSKQETKQPEPTDNQVVEPDKEPEPEPEPEQPKIPKSVTGLVIGFDKSRGLTDVVMVGVLDTETNQIKIISVPRDLEIDFSKEPFATIKKEDKNNKIGHCKLTEVYYDLGKTEEALLQLKKIVGAIVGLEIEYMATINVEGFVEMVDAVGGVEFDVPQRMYKRDPAQDLLINLQKGKQLLDGDKAMQLVRYRGYKLGDIQRIKVQQEFLVALYQKVLETKDLDTLVKLTNTVYGIVDADFGLNLAVEYVEYLFKLDKENLLSADNMVTIPSYGVHQEGKWYQFWDLEEARKTVDELVNK